MTSPSPSSPAVPPGERIYFSAVLYPNRSLSPPAFWIVMGVVAGVSFAAGLVFWSIGAWPVLGFYGLDVLLVYLAFRWSYRQGRLHEIIQLTDRELEIIRVFPGGRRHRVAFEPSWAVLDFDDPPAHESQIRIRSHGKETVVGSFLSPDERTELAEALRAALKARRQPDFSGSTISDTE